MEINYIILAHKNPEQIKRLICNLKGPDANFYLHIDGNTPSKPFIKKFQHFENIHFIKSPIRKKIIWGDISIVYATLGAMKQILKDQRGGYCILLSGQDYPLKQRNYIHSFLEKNNGTHYISIFSIPHPGWEKGGVSRLESYKINKSSQRKHFLLLPSIFEKDFFTFKTFGKLNYLRKSGKWKDLSHVFKKRKFPAYLKPYGGGQWWAFPIETVQKIIEFNSAHPDFLAYHHYTLIPDELFFTSILMHLKVSEEIPISKSITYVNWERISGPLPVTFQHLDFVELKEASKDHLFARKFDIELDSQILDEIDQKLIQ